MTKKEIYPIGVLLIVLAIGVADSPLMAAKLQQKTLTAWDEYVRLTEERIKEELNSSTGFLAQDFQAVPKAKMERDAALSGQILVERMKTLNPRGRKIKVPAGTIHHWRGSVFIPDVDLESVLAQVRNPAQQEQLQEDVLGSRILEESDDSLRLYLKLVRSKIVTVTYNTEHLSSISGTVKVWPRVEASPPRLPSWWTPAPPRRGKSRKERTMDSYGD